MAMRDTFNEINITPLTDIFLVLLIIMMVIAPLMDQQGLNLTVPDVVKEENIKKNKFLNVLVTEDNKFIIDGDEVAESDLEMQITKLKEGYPDGLIISTEPDSMYGAVVKVMDKARNAGVTSISVVDN